MNSDIVDRSIIFNAMIKELKTKKKNIEYCKRELDNELEKVKESRRHLKEYTKHVKEFEKAICVIFDIPSIS